jgi:DNA polymerase-3 subunit beta
LKILIEKNSLVLGLAQVQRAISTKITMPILNNILLKTKNDNEITLSSTDLELSLSTSVNAQIQEPGSILLPARNLLELARRFPSGNISISTDPLLKSIKIKYAQSELVLNTMDINEFPIFSFNPEQSLFSIHSQDLKNMIRKVSTSISSNHIRPVFSGALCEKDPEGLLIMASTDTHRLTVIKQQNVTFFSSETPMKLIIPGRTLNEIYRLIEEDIIVNFGLIKNQLVVSFGRTTLISRLIDGQFPNYQQVIPNEWCTKMSINTQDFLEAVERASLIAKEEVKIKTNLLMLNLSNGLLEIDSNSPAIGRIHEELPAECEGEDIKIIFNAKYLLDGLKITETENLTMKLTGPSTAAVLAQGEDNYFTYLLLPIRIQNENN